MTCLPQELILTIFSMYYNLSDIINLAESDQYVFDIYKANIDKVINNLRFNNKKKHKIISDVIWGAYFYDGYENYKEHNIDTKLDIVKKINNYLLITTHEQLLDQLELVKTMPMPSYHFKQELFPLFIRFYNYCYMKIVKGHDNRISHISSYLTLDKYNTFIHYVNLGNDTRNCFHIAMNFNKTKLELLQKYIDRGLVLEDAMWVALHVNKDDVEKVFELYEEYSICILDADTMVKDFDETQIEKTKRLIRDDNIYSDFAFNLVEKFNDAEIKLFIKLYKILIKNDCYVFDETLDFIADHHCDETELNIMIKLAENNFKTDNLVHITNSLVNLNNNDEYSIMKCIELKNKGISEYNIIELIDLGIHKEIDYEYYESLIKNNHTPKEAIEMIIADQEKIEMIIDYSWL